jgi:hypothetical protein
MFQHWKASICMLYPKPKGGSTGITPTSKKTAIIDLAPQEKELSDYKGSTALDLVFL